MGIYTCLEKELNPWSQCSSGQVHTHFRLYGHW